MRPRMATPVYDIVQECPVSVVLEYEKLFTRLWTTRGQGDCFGWLRLRL
jgi:hypothetical protein